MAIDARHNVNPNTGHYAEEVQTFDDDRGVGVDACHVAAHHRVRVNQTRRRLSIRRAAEHGKFEPR